MCEGVRWERNELLVFDVWYCSSILVEKRRFFCLRLSDDDSVFIILDFDFDFYFFFAGSRVNYFSPFSEIFLHRFSHPFSSDLRCIASLASLTHFIIYPYALKISRIWRAVIFFFVLIYLSKLHVINGGFPKKKEITRVRKNDKRERERERESQISRWDSDWKWNWTSICDAKILLEWWNNMKNSSG